MYTIIERSDPLLRKQRFMRNATGAAALTVAAALVTQEAHSQAAAPEADSSQELQTVFVTARRRSEDLQKVPTSIAVLSGDDLQARQVNTQSDLQLTTPGLIVRESQSSSQQNYAIRGQSIDAYSSSQPAVLPYINEFQNSSIAASPFYDLSSVQVLKGPQGTLFGRNTTGGAVLYTTAKPSSSGVSGYFNARLGNFSERRFEGAINLPLNDALAVRFAGSSERRDGYVLNAVTGSDLNAIHRDSVRASLSWQPTDPLQIDLVAQYDRSYGLGDALEINSVYSPGQLGPAPNYYRLTSTAANFFSPALLDALAGPGAYAALQAKFPGVPAGGILAAVARQNAAGTRTVWLNTDPTHDSDGRLLISNIKYTISPELVVKNIAGYSRNYSNDGADNDGSPFVIIDEPLYANTNEQASEELQLEGKALSDRLSYISGIYLSRQKTSLSEAFSVLDVGPIADPLFNLPTHNTEAGQTIDKTEGVFTQATYDLAAWLPGLSFTAGGRFTWEQIDFTSTLGFTPDTHENQTESHPSWTVGLEYQVNPELMVYVENRGSWRAGGFNVTAPPIDRPATEGGNRFAPEKTHDVEIGFKFQGEVTSMPARLNVAAFNQWVDDVQRVIYANLPGLGPNSLTTNIAGGATVRGVEFDTQIRPARWLTLGGAFNFTDAAYGNPHNLTVFGSPVDFDTFADLTRYSGNAYARVRLPIPNKLGLLTLHTEIYAQSRQDLSNTGGYYTPNTTLRAYQFANARLEWEDVGQSSLSITAFVKNIAAKEYYVGGLALGGLLGYNMVLPGEPRTYGVELGYRF